MAASPFLLWYDYPMRVLGLDPSLTNFGWAIHVTGVEGRQRRESSGRFHTSRKNMDFVDRNVYLRESVRSLIREHRPDRVSVESPVFKEEYSEGMYGLFVYVNEALKTERVDAVFWTPPTLKAYARDFLGRPKVDGKVWKMSKSDMIDAARKHTGGGSWSSDEADAYWAAVVGARFWLLYDGVITSKDLTERERANFLRIHKPKRGKKAGRVIKSGVIHKENSRFFLWSKSESINGEKGNLENHPDNHPKERKTR